MFTFVFILASRFAVDWELALPPLSSRGPRPGTERPPFKVPGPRTGEDGGSAPSSSSRSVLT